MVDLDPDILLRRLTIRPIMRAAIRITTVLLTTDTDLDTALDQASIFMAAPASS